jgi:hypothetical protein
VLRLIQEALELEGDLIKEDKKKKLLQLQLLF